MAGPTRRINRPFGRYMEEVQKLSEDEKARTAIRHSTRIGGDSTIGIWPNRKAMAKEIRREEKSAPVSQWCPLVKLEDNEGY